MKVELNMSATPTGVVFPFGRFCASLGPAQSVIERYPRRHMPCIGQLMNGIIAHVESPSLFYVLLLSDTQQLQNLQNSLQNAIAAALQVPPPKSYKPGMPVAGYFNCFWYRAEVVEHIEGAPTAKVFYVDYGNTADQSLDFIRPLPPSLMTLPPLALKCGLVGLKPHNQWSETESEVFIQLVLVEKGSPPKQLTVTMVGTTGRDRIAQVELFTDGRTCIGKLLPDLLKSKGFPDPSLATSAPKMYSFQMYCDKVRQTSIARLEQHLGLRNSGMGRLGLLRLKKRRELALSRMGRNVKYLLKNVTDPSKADPKCPICLAMYAEGEVNLATQCHFCSTVFHKQCMTALLLLDSLRKTKAICPTCKTMWPFEEDVV